MIECIVGQGMTVVFVSLLTDHLCLSSNHLSPDSTLQTGPDFELENE